MHVEDKHKKSRLALVFTRKMELSHVESHNDQLIQPHGHMLGAVTNKHLEMLLQILKMLEKFSWQPLTIENARGPNLGVCKNDPHSLEVGLHALMCVPSG